jgi:transcriptional regulator with XRE-family HTH domain
MYLNKLVVGIQQLFEKRNVSRNKLSELSNVSLPTIRKVLRGDTNVSLKTLEKLYNTLYEIPKSE